MCINDSKLYVYTEMGILCDRISYEDMTIKYGKPECISENGQNFVFRKSSQSYDFNIISLSYKGLTF